jgi:hypothetical protein
MFILVIRILLHHLHLPFLPHLLPYHHAFHEPLAFNVVIGKLEVILTILHHNEQFHLLQLPRHLLSLDLHHLLPLLPLHLLLISFLQLVLSLHSYLFLLLQFLLLHDHLHHLLLHLNLLLNLHLLLRLHQHLRLHPSLKPYLKGNKLLLHSTYHNTQHLGAILFVHQ